MRICHESTCASVAQLPAKACGSEILRFSKSICSSPEDLLYRADSQGFLLLEHKWGPAATGTPIAAICTVFVCSGRRGHSIVTGLHRSPCLHERRVNVFCSRDEKRAVPKFRNRPPLLGTKQLRSTGGPYMVGRKKRCIEFGTDCSICDGTESAHKC